MNIQLLWKHLESPCWWKVLCWSFLLCTFGWRIYITSMLFKNGTYPFHCESNKQASNLYNVSCYLFPNSPSLYSHSSEVSTSMTRYYICSHNFFLLYFKTFYAYIKSKFLGNALLPQTLLNLSYVTLSTTNIICPYHWTSNSYLIY